MYYYFSSNYPAVIKLNGIYYGTIHNAVKTLRIDVDAPFVEVCPLNGSESPTCLLVDGDFLKNPPERVFITDLGGGYMLKFNGGFNSTEFKVLRQEKYADAVATVFSEKGYKLSIETQNDFYAENIAFSFQSAEFFRTEKYKNLLAVFFYGEKTLVNIYQTGGQIKKLFGREVDSAEFNGKLTTVEIKADVAKHKITTEWQFSGGEISAVSRRVERATEFNIDSLNEKTLPYAFLEEVLAGGDYTPYLGEGVRENAGVIKDYLGDFIGVFPPPVFRDIEEVGLVYAKGKNLYKVEYFKFELKDRKIVNITC